MCYNVSKKRSEKDEDTAQTDGAARSRGAKSRKRRGDMKRGSVAQTFISPWGRQCQNICGESGDRQSHPPCPNTADVASAPSGSPARKHGLNDGLPVWVLEALSKFHLTRRQLGGGEVTEGRWCVQGMTRTCAHTYTLWEHKRKDKQALFPS